MSFDLADITTSHKSYCHRARSDPQLNGLERRASSIDKVFDEKQLFIAMLMQLVFAQLGLICLAGLAPAEAQYHASPKLAGPAALAHESADSILNSLDVAIDKLTNIYTQALLSGTHTPELEISLRALELELYELLDRLYKQHRLKDYMKYESEVSKQMIIYNLLKELFGYTQHVEKS